MKTCFDNGGVLIEKHPYFVDKSNSEAVALKSGCRQPGASSAIGCSTKGLRCMRGWGMVNSSEEKDSVSTAIMSMSISRSA